MRTPLRLALVGALLVGGPLAVAVAGPAGAGAGFSVTVDGTGNPDQAVYRFQFPANDCTANTVVTIPTAPDADILLDDANSGTITMPSGTPGGTYDIEVSCDDAAGAPISSTGGFSFAAVTVTKVASGDVPADAVFAVSVTCVEPTRGSIDSFAEGGGLDLLNVDLAFGSSGGSQYLVAYHAQICTVSETDDGGATDSSLALDYCGDVAGIDAATTEAAGPSGRFDIVEPTDCTQTISNVFAGPAAQPADVVQQQPAFTG